MKLLTRFWNKTKVVHLSPVRECSGGYWPYDVNHCEKIGDLISAHSLTEHIRSFWWPTIRWSNHSLLWPTIHIVWVFSFGIHSMMFSPDVLFLYLCVCAATSSCLLRGKVIIWTWSRQTPCNTSPCWKWVKLQNTLPSRDQTTTILPLTDS